MAKEIPYNKIGSQESLDKQETQLKTKELQRMVRKAVEDVIVETPRSKVGLDDFEKLDNRRIALIEKKANTTMDSMNDLQEEGLRLSRRLLKLSNDVSDIEKDITTIQGDIKGIKTRAKDIKDIKDALDNSSDKKTNQINIQRDLYLKILLGISSIIFGLLAVWSYLGGGKQ